MQQELSRFLRYLEVERGCSPGTIEAYRDDLEKGLFPFLNGRGIFNLRSVTKDDIRAYMDFLALEKGNANITRRRKLASIKSLFNYLMGNENLNASPAASVKSPKITGTKPVYLTEIECLDLLKTIAKVAKPKVKGRDMRLFICHCEGHQPRSNPGDCHASLAMTRGIAKHSRDMAIVLLFLHTGLRVSELTNLRLEDTDLRSAQIKVTRKGNKEQYLHLNGEAVSALVNYLHSRPHDTRLPRFARNDRRLLPQAQNGRFFVGTKGGNLSRTYVYEVVRRYLKLAGINKDKQGPHILRHTFCTRLHQKGVDPLVIKNLAGHRSLDTTMKYVSIENEEETQALDKLVFNIL